MNFVFVNLHSNFHLFFIQELQPLFALFKEKKVFFFNFSIDNIDLFPLLKLPLHHQHINKTLYFNFFRHHKDLNQIPYSIIVCILTIDNLKFLLHNTIWCYNDYFFSFIGKKVLESLLFNILIHILFNRKRKWYFNL